MEASFVSRAKTAFHSAASKAEKVFKHDPIVDRGGDSDKQLNAKDESEENHEVKNPRRRPAPIKTKHDWHERLKNIRIGKKGLEDPEKAGNSPMAYAILDENLYPMSERGVPQLKDSNCNSPVEGLCYSNSDIIPPTAVVKQLAVAVEAAKSFKSMSALLASSRDSSPVRERASLGFSAVKSLVLREKEEKLSTEFGNNEKVISVIKMLLDAEGQFPVWKTDSGLGALTNITSLHKDIHGAPPDCFLVKVSEAIGSLKTLRKMASFWSRIVSELRRLWSEGQYIPGIPLDEIPDLNLCLLYQQLQVINCCVSRKKRRSAATESLDAVLRQTSSNIEVSSVSGDADHVHSIMFARLSTGEIVPRLGADKQSGDLTMLETGEPIYEPVMQEVPLLTEDLIKETEEFVLRTGSVGAGCSQLLSDMQAFKAANPGCTLEDFVRWHSPPDWMETDMANEANETCDGGDLLSSKGQLSRRMQKEGNLWLELWETAKPVPAVQQTPLFDEDLSVEGILDYLEDISPSELFEPLFISLLGTGFIIAEVTLSTNSSLSKLFYECKNYIVATCQNSNWIEKVDDICQVYETVETMLLNPDEVIKITVQPEETTPTGELKNRFKRISLIFSSKDRNSGKTPPSKESKNTDENSVRQSFTSIFSKKPPKPSSGSPAEKPLNSVENDWTIV